MPGDVRGLYRTIIARAERAFGRATVSAFLGAIAVSRFGWRESDFRTLMPSLSGAGWDDLRFATLRRLFRGHLYLRQPLGRWDFVHRQLRETVRGWLAEIGVDGRTIHAATARHLLALPAADPVRLSETMLHLLEAEDWPGAADYLGHADDEGVREGALAILVEAVRAPIERTREEVAERLIKLLVAPERNDATIAGVADRLIDVHFRSQGRSSVATERTILTAVDETLAALSERHPRQRAFLRIHMRCLRFLGHSLKDGGDLEGALRAYQRADSVAQRIAELEGATHGEPAGDGIAIGDALFSRREFEGALAHYRRAAQAGSSTAVGRVGVALRMLGDFEGALAALRRALALLEQEVAENPRSQPLRFNLGIAHSTIASTLADMGDLVGALAEYRKAMTLVSEIAAQNPLEPQIQSQWAQMYLRIAMVLQRQGDAKSALGVIRQGKPIVDRLLGAHGDNPHYWREAGLFELTSGDLAAALGDRDAALDRWRAAAAIFDRLAAQDATNAQWRSDLDLTRRRMAQLTEHL